MAKQNVQSKQILNKESEKVAKILLKIKAVTLNPKKPYKFASGILSPVYIDCRLLIGYPNERKLIRDLYIKRIKTVGKFDVIGGTATAGIPHAAFISEKMNLPMIYIRGKSKDHGKGNQIEGKFSENQKVAVIEDLISTGSSSIDSVRGIRSEHGKANYVFAIITYGMKFSIQNYKANNIKLVSLTTFEETVKVAQKLKLIKPKDKEIILDWTKDPSGWGKKHGFE